MKIKMRDGSVREADIIDLLNGLPENEEISFYQQGE